MAQRLHGSASPWPSVSPVQRLHGPAPPQPSPTAGFRPSRSSPAPQHAPSLHSARRARRPSTVQPRPVPPHRRPGPAAPPSTAGRPPFHGLASAPPRQALIPPHGSASLHGHAPLLHTGGRAPLRGPAPPLHGRPPSSPAPHGRPWSSPALHGSASLHNRPLTAAPSTASAFTASAAPPAHPPLDSVHHPAARSLRLRPLRMAPPGRFCCPSQAPAESRRAVIHNPRLRTPTIPRTAFGRHPAAIAQAP
ncbi:hypothetical protein HD596_012048 [Nonomuraea jabiensis]|uniref:Uncharacterized protein n=1 Tax=Nonomuraea jabiensis TaxID=882448 RepID=A0A7W9LIQ7_9ACTN|nr:hypothetical protein [Nonomuraea jabiensis]